MFRHGAFFVLNNNCLLGTKNAAPVWNSIFYLG